MSYYRDSATGLPFDAQPAYVPDPPARTEPLTPYLTDEESVGVYRKPVWPNQPNFDTDKGITG